MVRHWLMVRWVVGSILHGVDPYSYFSFQPVLHDWCNKGCGMCYPVCGTLNKTFPSFLIAVSARYALCKWELRNIVHKRREQYKVDILTKDLLEGIAWDSRPPPDNWKPRGLLVAHLQEHRSAVNR